MRVLAQYDHEVVEKMIGHIIRCMYAREDDERLAEGYEVIDMLIKDAAYCYSFKGDEK